MAHKENSSNTNSDDWHFLLSSQRGHPKRKNSYSFTRALSRVMKKATLWKVVVQRKPTFQTNREIYFEFCLKAAASVQKYLTQNRQHCSAALVGSPLSIAFLTTETCRFKKSSSSTHLPEVPHYYPANLPVQLPPLPVSPSPEEAELCQVIVLDRQVLAVSRSVQERTCGERNSRSPACNTCPPHALYSVRSSPVSPPTPFSTQSHSQVSSLDHWGVVTQLP